MPQPRSLFPSKIRYFIRAIVVHAIFFLYLHIFRDTQLFGFPQLHAILGAFAIAAFDIGFAFYCPLHDVLMNDGDISKKSDIEPSETNTDAPGI